LYYFYTIKDLRVATVSVGVWSRVRGCVIAVFDLAVADSPVVISELAQLFWNLKHVDIASITPTMEAKLALVNLWKMCCLENNT